MDDTAITALEESIAYWERIVKMEVPSEGASSCALCEEYWSECSNDVDDRHWDVNGNRLEGEVPVYDMAICPVARHAGDWECNRTPYGEFARASVHDEDHRFWATTPKANEAAKKELEFLKEVLAEERKG